MLTGEGRYIQTGKDTPQHLDVPRPLDECDRTELLCGEGQGYYGEDITKGGRNGREELYRYDNILPGLHL